MKAYVILIVLLLIITAGLFGIQTTPSNCTCTSISLGSNYCLGSVACEENDENCIPLTCETKYELLGEIDTGNSQIQTYTILIIDASKSMEGENLDATKRASKSFVQQISEQQYVAIVEFNDKATKLTDFSNDKIELFSSIDLINPKGRTKFLQPFTLANELFNEVPEDAGKYILFLSDGAPEDQEELFLEEIEQLKEQKVNTYALAFSGKSNEEIMKKIASKDSNLYLVSTAEDIESKFSEAYRDILAEGDISLELRETKTTARLEEHLNANLISNHNGMNLLEKNNYCPLQTTHYIEAKKGNTFSRILGVQKEDTIEYPLSGLESGTYELIGHSKIFLDECTMSATTQFGNLQIVDETDCDITCLNIDTAMHAGKNTSYVREDHQRISWNIFIDKSSSMSQGEQLVKAIADTSTLLSFMPAYDTVSLGSFDRKVELYTTHAQPSPIQSSAIKKIVPSASTQLLSAIKKAKELETSAPNQQSHTIIITDGNYGEVNLNEIEEALKSLQGCISTINYGTHLLREEEEAHKLIISHRKCGEDFITQPTSHELQQLVYTNLSNTPELIIRTQKTIEKNQSKYLVQVISSFSGVSPLASNELCAIEPLIEIEIQRKDNTIEQLSGKKFTTAINESYTITTSFDNSACSYETSTSVQFDTAKKNNILKIVSIIMLVLAINILVFSYVLNKRLKNIKTNLEKHEKKK